MESTERPSFTLGDYIELKSPRDLKGKRGYVRERAAPTESCNDRFRVVLDDLEAETNVATITTSARNIKLLRKHKQVISTRVCDYYLDSFPSLGTAAASTLERPISLDPATPYGKLPRPSISELPGPHTLDSIFETLDAETFFRTAYSGRNVIIRWWHDFDGESVESANPQLIVQVYTNDDDSTCLTTCSFDFHRRPARAEWTETTCFDDLKLVPSQIQSLAARLLHLLLRLAGHDMGLVQLYHAYLYLRMVYVADKSWWTEALDLAILYTDLSLQATHSNKLDPSACEEVARSLHAAGHDLQAAAIYGQGAESLLARGVVKGENDYDYCKTVVRLWNRQAVAYAYLRRYSDSERALLSAMRAIFAHVKGNQVFGDPLFADMWCRLQTVYQSWIHVDEHSEMREVDLLLWAMVDAAKCFDAMTSNWTHLLVAKFTSSPSKAREALKKAFCSASVESFHETILSWRKPGTSIADKDETCSTPPELPSRKKWREGKRARQRNEIAQICRKSLCANTGCECWEDDKLMKCTSCKSVKYCSAACQLAHRQEHKPECKRISAHLAKLTAKSEKK